MLTPARTLLSLSFAVSIVATVFAQTTPPDGQPVAPIVTATASTARVRYVSVGEVHQTRLQVFSANGAEVFDSGFRLGNLIDWQLQDQQGLRLSSGTYLYLVTVKDFSERSTQRYGSALLDQNQVDLEQTSIDSLSQAQAAALELNRDSETLSAVDRIGVTAMSRPGGTSTDGSTPAEGRASGTESSQPETDGDNISGSGTQNFLSKWLDNGGTLGDSVLFESSGRIGLGTTSPGAKFHVIGAQGSIGGGTFQLDTSTPFSAFTGAYPAFEIINTNGTNNNVSLFQFADAPSGAAHAGIGAVNTNHALDFGNLFFFTKAPADGYQVRMGVYGSNVGIGTTNPSARLHVAGGEILFENKWRTETTLVNPGPVAGPPNLIGGFLGTGPAGATPGNRVTAGVAGATIGGGGFNGTLFYPSGPGIAGDGSNRVTDYFGTVGGGFNNIAGSDDVTVDNALYATVGGGEGNNASRAYSTVGGGSSNIASANYSTVPGGFGNAAQGEASFAAGQRALANHDGTFVWADKSVFASFASTGPNQFLVRATGGVGIGTNNPGTALLALNAAAGQKGLEILRGRVVLSYGTVAGGGTIPSDVAVVNIVDDGGPTVPTVALPASSEDGTVIVVGTTDTDGASVTGALGGPEAISPVVTRRFIRIAGVWKTEL